MPILRNSYPDVLERSSASALPCRYGEDEARIDILTLEVVDGWLPRSRFSFGAGVDNRTPRRTHQRLAAMLNESTIKQDFSSLITSQVRSPIPWRVAEVTPLPSFRLSVGFIDGMAGIVDFAEMIHSPQAGVFAVLTDPTLFAEVFVKHGVVTWPGELDIAPDAMYAELKKYGEWKLR